MLIDSTSDNITPMLSATEELDLANELLGINLPAIDYQPDIYMESSHILLIFKADDELVFAEYRYKRGLRLSRWRTSRYDIIKLIKDKNCDVRVTGSALSYINRNGQTLPILKDVITRCGKPYEVINKSQE